MTLSGWIALACLLILATGIPAWIRYAFAASQRPDGGPWIVRAAGRLGQAIADLLHLDDNQRSPRI